MTAAALRKDLELLQRQLATLVNRANREPFAASIVGTHLGDALDAAARARDDLAQALREGSRP